MKIFSKRSLTTFPYQKFTIPKENIQRMVYALDFHGSSFPAQANENYCCWCNIDLFPLRSRRKLAYPIWREMVLKFCEPNPCYLTIARLAHRLSNDSFRRKGRSTEGRSNLLKLIAELEKRK
jgi:hypothetical protein